MEWSGTAVSVFCLKCPAHSFPFFPSCHRCLLLLCEIVYGRGNYSSTPIPCGAITRHPIVSDLALLSPLYSLSSLYKTPIYPSLSLFLTNTLPPTLRYSERCQRNLFRQPIGTFITPPVCPPRLTQRPSKDYSLWLPTLRYTSILRPLEYPLCDHIFRVCAR